MKIVGVLLVLALAVAGCERRALPRLIFDTRPILMFGFMPYSDTSHMRSLYRAIEGYLASTLKLEMRFLLTRDYLTMGRLVEHEMVDIAWFTPASYALIGRKIGARPICKPFRRGRATYRPIIITRADRPFKGLADLKGRRFAYVERNSTSGFIVPNQMLAKIGIDEPLEFFSETTFTHNHLTSLRGVAEGLFDAAAVYEGAPDEMAHEKWAAPLHTIAVGPAVPNDPIVYRRGLDPSLVEKLRKLFLTMHENEAGRKALSELNRLERITRFLSAEDVDYTW